MTVKGEALTVMFTGLAFDAVALISAANKELNQRRRDLIKPGLNTKYKQLCYNTTETKYLFGDDLSKSVKEITETNRLGFQVEGNRGKFRRGRPTYTSNRGSFRGRHFLGQRRPYYRGRQNKKWEEKDRK